MPIGRGILEKSHLDGAEEPDIPEHFYFKSKLYDRGMSRTARGLFGKFLPEKTAAQRCENYCGLTERLSDVSGISLLFEKCPPEVCPLFLPLRVHGGVQRRDDIVNNLRKCGVEAIPWWHGFHRKFSWEGFDDARSLKQSIIVLPVLPHFTTEDLDFIEHSFTEQKAVRIG